MVDGNHVTWGQLLRDFCCPCEINQTSQTQIPTGLVQSLRPLLSMPERLDRRNFVLWGYRGIPTIQMWALYQACYEIFRTTCSNRTSLSRAHHTMGTIAYALIKLCRCEVHIRIGNYTPIPDDHPMFYKLEWLCDNLWRAVSELKEDETFEQWLGKIGDLREPF